MEFTVYGHEIGCGPDVGMHFCMTLENTKVAVREYREALWSLNPGGEPLGTLGVYEITARLPNITTMIDLLNSPDSIFMSCLISKKLVAADIDVS
ncbi:hypothetical protein GGQ73_002991 [Rhizobium skierniewicense]|uniref:Uncharacterized protein n=1 Tax=Rhizobium skierniewicense TaxID=984260 RepID=A0A7W6CBZ7_9HYPH|nr:hypothetical protein [Rhizobium skierniewicense]MBB3947027.1 hypothetical protein [Rhizobium skierniewicense]